SWLAGKRRILRQRVPAIEREHDPAGIEKGDLVARCPELPRQPQRFIERAAARHIAHAQGHDGQREGRGLMVHAASRLMLQFIRASAEFLVPILLFGGGWTRAQRAAAWGKSARLRTLPRRLRR